MSRSMNVKGMELRATADLVALLGPTTALKEPNKKPILDFGKLMKNLSLSGKDTQQIQWCLDLVDLVCRSKKSTKSRQSTKLNHLYDMI